MKWLVGIVGVVLTTVLTTWLLGSLNHVVPSPERSWLTVTNSLRGNTLSTEDRFRFVLCWLENDKNGDDTRIVAQAFSSVQGILLVRSARLVKASGAADDWQLTMQKNATTELEKWNADLAVVGVVKKSGEVLSLWFVPRLGDGTLSRGDQPYKLEDVTLGKDFHDDIRAQLTALALASVAPLAETEMRGRVLEKELGEVTEKLATLLQSSAINKPERRAPLYAALGIALTALGERESGTERLEQAVKAHRAALEERTRERVPLDWAATQNSLGSTLAILGERESGTERLEQAVKAYRAALEERIRKRVPLDWAATQSNLGVALFTLGERESGTERLEQAVKAHRAALEEHTRERVPLDWAATQSNLGAALTILGERESGTERLEQAVKAYSAALEEHTRERVPLDWAMTQNNLGAALTILGERESGTERLEQAVKAYSAALEEHTRERVPLDWAMAQNNLGNALTILGERESGTERLEQAVKAYSAALEERTHERVPLHWAATQNNLSNTLRTLNERKDETEQLEEP